MTEFRQFTDTTQPLYSGGELVTSLTSAGNLALFSFCPALDSVIAWSANLELLLGARAADLAPSLNLLLRHIHPEDRFRIQGVLETAIETAAPISVQYRWVRPDNGSTITILCRAQPVSRAGGLQYDGCLIDLSEIASGDNVAAAPQPVHSPEPVASPTQSGMQSFVQLSAGISHSINNMLQSVLGHLATLRAHPEDSAALLRECDAVAHLISQASQLTHELLSYRDSLAISPLAVDLNVTVLGALRKVKELHQDQLAVSVSLGAVPAILAIPSQLADAILTAIQYIHSISPEQSAYSVTTQQQIDLSSPFGASVSIQSIPTRSRRGKDLPHSSRSRLRLLEKQVGGGDQGLIAKVEALIERSGGSVVRSTHGLLLLLKVAPATVTGAHHQRAASTKPVDPVAPPIALLVDDDPEILHTLTQVLSNGGISVCTARCRKEAVQSLRKNPSIRIAIVDALLPGESGAQIVRKLRALQPELRVLGVSGASEPDIAPLLTAGAEEVLRKPFDPAILLLKVRAVLGDLAA